MKRAALIGLATWAACSGVYFFLLRGRIAAAVAVAIVAGLFMAVVIGTFRIAWSYWRDARRMLADDGSPPEDGKNVTLSGRPEARCGRRSRNAGRRSTSTRSRTSSTAAKRPR